jgi:predicted nucleic acid-binding Zn ribbon protein
MAERQPGDTPGQPGNGPPADGPADAAAGQPPRAAAGDQLGLAREALAAARAGARAKGLRPARPRPDGSAGSGQPRSRAGSAGTARPGFAAQPHREEPRPLAAAIEGLLSAEGWTLAAATGSVFGRWAQIVGGDLAAHTTPESLTDGELTVAADSTAWATQVRLLAAQLVRRLNAELGDGTVQRVNVRGPVTSTRKPGEWRVRGGRGPRDTYG